VVSFQSGVRQGDHSGHCSSRSPCRGPWSRWRRWAWLAPLHLRTIPSSTAPRHPPCGP
jgi:hypothetical protein